MSYVQILKLFGLFLASNLFSEAEGKKCLKQKNSQARIRPFEAQRRAGPFGAQDGLKEVEGRFDTYEPEARHLINDKVSDIRYLLYPIYYDKKPPVQIKMNDISSLDRSGFSREHGTKILIHGFTQNAEAPFPVNVRDAYLKAASLPGSRQVQVLIVDWGPLAKSLPVMTYALYSVIAQNVQIVGKDVARLIKFLNPSYDLVHIVGFSLGAHVSGVAGAEIQRTSGKKIGRITGLDPAGPSFGDGVILDKKLDKGDAVFVDVLHTDSDGFGTPAQCGDLDIYANGGADQPDCRDGGLINWATSIITACDHNRAPKYFALSIDWDTKFMACACDPWEDLRGKGCKLSYECVDPVRFGEYCWRQAQGKRYLEIRI